MGSCSNPHCQVDVTGECFEGLDDFTDCATYSNELISNALEDGEVVSEINDPEAGEPEVRVLSLPGKSRLNPDTTSEAISDFGGKVISLIGQANVGKTTLLASLYELFQWGPVGNWKFSGSRTIYPFEELSHTSRIYSRKSKPDTIRTSEKQGLSFYHLSVHDGCSKNRNLFIADRAGESYKNATDSSEECKKLIEVKRSEYIFLLVNGENLSEKSRKHTERLSAISMIEALSASGMVRKSAKIIVTLTKLDLVSEDSRLDVESEVDRIKSHAVSMLENIVSTLFVAARPEKEDDFKLGHGLDSLLDEIMTDVDKKIHLEIPSSNNGRLINEFVGKVEL